MPSCPPILVTWFSFHHWLPVRMWYLTMLLFVDVSHFNWFLLNCATSSWPHQYLTMVRSVCVRVVWWVWMFSIYWLWVMFEYANILRRKWKVFEYYRYKYIFLWNYLTSTFVKYLLWLWVQSSRHCWRCWQQKLIQSFYLRKTVDFEMLLMAKNKNVVVFTAYNKDML